MSTDQPTGDPTDAAADDSTDAPADDGVLELHPDSPLRRAALEIERHVAEAGWDQAPRLFALVRTADLVARQPELADQVGDGADGSFTPIEQEGVPTQDFEDALTHLTWPAEVDGCATVIERLMVPPEAEGLTPEELAAHPERQEVRLVAAVLRGGRAHSAVRRRAAGDGGTTDEPTDGPSDGPDSDLLEGPDLVPGLVALLEGTLAEDT